MCSRFTRAMFLDMYWESISRTFARRSLRVFQSSCFSTDLAPPPSTRHPSAAVDYAVTPPEGWTREVIPRKSVQGADAYYYAPCGKKMRSKPDVQRFLDKKRPEGKYTDVTIDQFDFNPKRR